MFVVAVSEVLYSTGGFSIHGGRAAARALGCSRRPCIKVRPAGPAEVKRHGLAARRPAAGRPEVFNDHDIH